MAHKKAAGSAKNLRDSKPKYRGVKLFGGQAVEAGNVILRQKGSRYICGDNTYMGKDFTIHAKVDGVVVFSKKKVEKFDGRKYLKTVVDVTSEIQKAAKKPAAKKTAAPKAEAKEEKAEKKAPAKKATAAKKPAAKKATTAKKAPAKKAEDK